MVSNSSTSRAADFLEQDKLLHLSAGFTFAYAANGGLRTEESSWWLRATVACGGAMALGGLKEGADSLGLGQASVEDWAATAVGGLLGWFLSEAVWTLVYGNDPRAEGAIMERGLIQ